MCPIGYVDPHCQRVSKAQRAVSPNETAFYMLQAVRPNGTIKVLHDFPLGGNLTQIVNECEYMAQFLELAFIPKFDWPFEVAA